MTLDKWIEHLQMGREIEFRYKEEAFLISYLPETEPLLFFIWNGTKNSEIYRGTLDEVLGYEFDDGINLRTAPDAFSVNYIL